MLHQNEAGQKLITRFAYSQCCGAYTNIALLYECQIVVLIVHMQPLQLATLTSVSACDQCPRLEHDLSLHHTARLCVFARVHDSSL